MNKFLIVFLSVLFLGMVLAEDFQCPYPYGQFKNPKDCSTYYNCINGKAILQKCQFGTKWDDHVRRCVHGPSAVCQIDQ